MTPSSPPAKRYRVFYILIIYNQGGVKESKTKMRQDVNAESPEEAISKVKKDLADIVDREILDLGMSFHDFQDFRAKRVA